MIRLWLIVLCIGVLMLLAQTAQARPEYAAREKAECIECHIMPHGAGARRMYGKVFGSRDLGMAKTSEQDLYYVDMRSIYLKNSESGNSNRNTINGLALMTLAGTLNVPVLENEDSGNASLVFTHDFGSLGAGTRDAYVLWENSETEGLLPSTMVFGKFWAPFGLMTDEHRTYTRYQTDTDWRNYEMGFSLGGNPFEGWHYDVAITNGYSSAGNFTNNDKTYGFIPNIRWNPESLPFMLGASYLFYDTEKTENGLEKDSPYAYSLYAVLSFNRMTNDLFTASLSAEVVDARYFNDNSKVGRFLDAATPSAYYTTVQDTVSRGTFIEFKWELTNQLIVSYKIDTLDFNREYGGDTFSRHGYGMRYQLNSNMMILARVETAQTDREDISKTSWAVQDDFFLLFRMWL